MTTETTRRPAGAGICLAFLSGMAVTALFAVLAVILHQPAVPPAMTAPGPVVPAPHPVPPAGSLLAVAQGGPALG